MGYFAAAGRLVDYKLISGWRLRATLRRGRAIGMWLIERRSPRNRSLAQNL